MTDADDRLRFANPIPPSAVSSPSVERSARADALFQEITMTDPNASAAPSPFSPPPSRESIAKANAPRRAPRKILAGTAAAAAAVIVGFGAVSLIPGSTTPAAAAMIDAAQQTQAADSGTITITLNVSDDVNAADSGEFTLTTNYSGDDLSARIDASNEAGLDGETPQVRVVDNVLYIEEGSTWYAVEDQRIMSLLGTFGLPTDVRQTMSAGVVELIELADNAVESADGSFTATVTAAEVKQVADGFPGFGLIANETLPADAAEHELELAVELDEDGLIDTVTLSGADADDTGAFHADVTIDFDDLDAGVIIEAPADAEVIDLDSFGDGELFDN